MCGVRVRVKEWGGVGGEEGQDQTGGRRREESELEEEAGGGPKHNLAPKMGEGQKLGDGKNSSAG